MPRKTVRASEVLVSARIRLANITKQHAELLAKFISDLDMSLPHITTFERCDDLIEYQCFMNLWKDVIENILDSKVDNKRNTPFIDRVNNLLKFCQERLNWITKDRAWECGLCSHLCHHIKLTEISAMAQWHHEMIESFGGMLDKIKSGELVLEDDVTLLLPITPL